MGEMNSNETTDLAHERICENVVKRFSKYFECFVEVTGRCDYRGSWKSVRCDVLLYDEVYGYLFGVEVKPFKEFQVEWLKKAFDQMVSYNNTAFPLPGVLSKPRHPNACFLFSPRLDWHGSLQEMKLQDMIALLPEGLGLASMVGNQAELRLTTGERIWSLDTGYHPEVDQLLAPQVGSKRVPHEAVGYLGASGKYKLASQVAQNRCEQVFR